MTNQKIGFMGGSYDPIHNGHLIMASVFVEYFNLDCCYFVPARVSPAKTHTNAIRTSEHRLRMVDLAIAGNPKFKIDDFEVRNDSVSYTYLTVAHFEQLYPDARLFMLIGTDQAEKFDTWRNYKLLLDRLTIGIAGRLSTEESKARIESVWRLCGKEPIFIPSPEIEISSEMLRSRLNAGLGIDYFAPPDVARYARECGDY